MVAIPLVDEDFALRDPDVRLMLQLRDGSDEAFEQLMANYQERVLAVLYHLLGDRQAAEDLTQEAFLRVYRSRFAYRPRAKFTTWLYTIVNNLASSALRQRNRNREVPLDTGEDSQALATRPKGVTLQARSGSMPVRKLEKAEDAEAVRQALSSLSDRQRMAVLLCKFEEMAYGDIAAVMNLSPLAVKSLLSRARTNLREALEPYVQLGTRPM